MRRRTRYETPHKIKNKKSVSLFEGWREKTRLNCMCGKNHTNAPGIFWNKVTTALSQLICRLKPILLPNKSSTATPALKTETTLKNCHQPKKRNHQKPVDHPRLVHIHVRRKPRLETKPFIAIPNYTRSLYYRVLRGKSIKLSKHHANAVHYLLL